MSPDQNPAVRELLETRLDALHEGQQNISHGLERIEKQVRETNGRVTGLELREEATRAVREEHLRMAALQEQRRARWNGILPAAIAGTCSGVAVLLVTLLLTGQI